MSEPARAVSPIPYEMEYTLRVVKEVVQNAPNVQHSFMGESEYSALVHSGVGDASQVYWKELLARVHIGSHLSLMRTNSWLNALCSAWQAENLYAYTATFRGLLESTADTWFSFQHVVFTLADNHYHSCRALKGKSSILETCGAIEDALIHFTHGRKLDKESKSIMPASHSAMLISKYIESLGEKRADAVAVYDRLCAFTHPAAESLMIFVEDYNSEDWRLINPSQKSLISGFHQVFMGIFTDLLMRAINLPICALKLLNTYEDVTLFTRPVVEIGMRNISAWQEIEKRISRSSQRPLRSRTVDD